MRWLMLCSVVGFFLLGGCGKEASPSENLNHAQPISYQQQQEYQAGIEAKRIAEKHRRVQKAVSIALKDQLTVGIKVTNFDRLYLSQTRAEVIGSLQKKFPDKKVKVTTDSKLFGVLENLEKMRAKGAIRAEDVEKRLEKVNLDMKR
ncbi:hypothetical protein [Mechercharimyces sp. CAU 1602]|uniref:hypothetical protein n=1 Tax=Mechercharimyces sp. CAU 1602 TaxID=2973933 RepID=UPI0021612D85|nr:hypothetical protein [Mechercharimyces sp. CAU 1602]MCS1350152.1 hypothetical protein [Mechercharimyces sp. CAU 1602]